MRDRDCSTCAYHHSLTSAMASICVSCVNGESRYEPHDRSPVAPYRFRKVGHVATTETGQVYIDWIGNQANAITEIAGKDLYILDTDNAP